MAGRYQAYPEYKDSGVEMLGDIPTHWNTRQVRFLLKDGAEGIKIGPFGSALKLEDMVDSGIRVYGQENVIKKDFTLGKRKISQYKFKEMQVYQVYPNDLLITMMGTSGKCELVPGNIDIGIIDSHLLRLRVKEGEIIPRFFRLLIEDCDEVECQIKISGKGSIMHGLNSSIVKALLLPLPRKEEQENILHFLDHETAKIDTLIEKQQQLIKLLKEKRQAVISHAVTKGLNPDAPMKDSGVEWLGNVPEHWDVVPLKYLCNLLKDGTHLPPPRVDFGVPLLSVRNIINGKLIFRDDDSNISEKEYKKLCKPFIPQKGDVVLAIVGATLGKVAIVEEMSGFHIQRSLAIFRVNPCFMTKEYLANVFSSTNFQSILWENVGFSAQPGIYLGTLKNFKLPVPSLDEQNEIRVYCSSITSRIDMLINKAVSAIKLMHERRTALISAAVTGKIDVRNWKAPEQDKTKKENVL